MRPFLAPGVCLALLVAFSSAARAGGLRDDELSCEEAADHLAHCCPGFDATQFACSYSTGCGSTFYPTVSVDDARCIVSTDCSTLVANGACQRAMAPSSNYAADGGGYGPQPVSGSADAGDLVYGPDQRICR